MTRFLRKVFFYVLFFAITGASAQHRLVKKANESFENYAFDSAITYYLKAVEKDLISDEVLKRLGDSYYYLADLKNAGIWYDRLFKEAKSAIAPEYMLRYAQTLRYQGRDKEAETLLNQIEDSGKGGANKEQIEVLKKQNALFNAHHLPINSPYSDFAPALNQKELVFSSARDTGFLVKNRQKWNTTAFLDLYKAPFENNTPGEVRKFSKNINTRFHESSATFTKDGKTMYFTRGGNENVRGKGERQRLKIYKASLKGGEWQDVVELPFNSDQYSSAHPALSPDEKRLYFASDMPGTYGDSDIFYVQIEDNGTYGKPVNLGNTVNTLGRETFPFVGDDLTLYFSSDGHKGFGGLDLFAVKPEGVPMNLGKAINSPFDDFTLVMSHDGKVGFFASNRPGGAGNDDIYMFEIDESLADTERALVGMITDVETGEVIPDVLLTLLDAEKKPLQSVRSDAEGGYIFPVKKGNEGLAEATKEGYFKSVEAYAINENLDTLKVNIKLLREIHHPEEGYDLAKLMRLNPIYFDFDKYFIRDDARIELDKLIALLKEYPDVFMEVRSYTDRRGSASYNDYLSEQRAKSTVSYLINNGIDTSRLTGKGFGERYPAVKCLDNCDEQDHALNRRSEFIITNEVFYTVQIGAFRKDAALPDEVNHEKIFSYVYDDDLRRFYSGVFDSEAKADEHKAKLVKQGFKDAFTRKLTSNNNILK